MTIVAPRRRAVIAGSVTALIVAGFGIFGVASPASAALLTVTSSADSGPGSLRQLIADNVGNSIISFDDSVTSIALLSTITMPDGLQIIGPGSDQLTISRGNTDDFAIFELAPTVAGQSFEFDGIRFDGNADGGGGRGAAVYASNAGFPVVDVTLRDIHVVDNRANLGAGFATYQSTGDVLIEDSVFQGNSAINGGALSLESFGGSLTVIDSRFIGNEAAGNLGAEGKGGAIFHDSQNSGNNLTITGSVFTGNSAIASGGAVYVESVPDATSTSIGTSSFIGNTAANNGGAIAVNTATGGLGVDSSTFTGNSAGDLGTSLWIDVAEGQAGIENSTIDESEDAFEAIYIYQLTGGFFIFHSTIVAPSAIYVDGNDNDLLGIENSILDVSGTEAIFVNTGDPAVARYNAFSTTLADEDIENVIGNLFSVDALLAPLADNGGPTLTRLPASTSPVIDLGDPAVTIYPQFDQRSTGFPRVVNGRVDMGALETAPSAPTLAATGSVEVTGIFLAAILFLAIGAAAARGARRRDA